MNTFVLIFLFFTSSFNSVFQPSVQVYAWSYITIISPHS